MSIEPLSLPDLVAASALVIAAGALSLASRLGLERRLAVAVGGAVVQLLALGWLMKVAIEQSSLVAASVLAIVMVLAAGRQALIRQQYDLGGWRTYWLGTGALLAGGVAVSAFTLVAVIGPKPWYDARYVLAILGLIVGNVLTSVSLVLDALFESVRIECAAIEARLALGAGRWRALERPLRDAMRAGLAPAIGTMTAGGAMVLPSMMAGQVLAGVDPFEAAKLQIVMLFALAGASGFAAVVAAAGAALMVTDGRHRLRIERLARR
jgi:putative ABC transport system permease protein